MSDSIDQKKSDAEVLAAREKRFRGICPHCAERKEIFENDEIFPFLASVALDESLEAINNELLEIMIARHVEFFSPGGSYQRHICVIMMDLLGREASFFDDVIVSDPELHRLLDPLVDEAIKRMNKRRMRGRKA